MYQDRERRFVINSRRYGLAAEESPFVSANATRTLGRSITLFA
jgi:hypothetical protein